MDWWRTVHSIKSDRASDRTKGTKALIALLDSENALKVLASGNLTPPMDMNEVFFAVNQLVAKEALQLQMKECRAGGSVNRLNQAKVKLNRLIAKFLSKSGEVENKIKIEYLTEALTDVFTRTYLRENFGGYYFSSILNIILTRRSYWGEISSTKWKELIKISIVAYDDDLKNLEKFTVARAITYLTSQGSLNTEISLWLPGRVKFFENTVNAAAGESASNQEYALMMAVIFSKVIAKEHRKILATFGENVMEAVLNMYDTTKTEADLLKNFILEFIQLQMKVHHPGGAVFGSVEAHVEDCHKWASLLEKMFSLISEEINYVHRRKYGLRKEEVLHNRFIEVAVDVLFQLTKMSEEGIPAVFGDSNITPNENIKNEVGILVVLQSIKERNDDGAVWPWLSIINEAVKKYGGSIFDTAYLTFLELIFELLGSSRESLIMSYAFKCCSSLAKANKPDKVNKDEYFHAWQKIWDIALRTVGLNLYEDATHEAIRTLMDKIQQGKQLADVLNLYLSGCIVASTPSIKTLWYLLRFPLVGNMVSSAQQHLLNWVFPSKTKPGLSQKLCPAEIQAGILVHLCVCGNIKFPSNVESAKVVGEIDEFYQKINFASGLLIPRPIEIVEDEKMSCEQLSAEQNLLTSMKEIVSKEIQSMISWIADLLKGGKVSQEWFVTAEYASHRLQLLVLISSYLLEWEIIDLTTLNGLGFLELYKRLYNNLTELLIELFLKYQDSNFGFSGVLKKLKELYELPLVPVVNKFIKEHTPHQAINFVINVIKERPVEVDEIFERRQVIEYLKKDLEPYVRGTMDSYVDYYSILSPQILRRNDSIKVIACQVLGSFSCSPADYQIIPLQRQVITQILTKLPHEYQSNFPLFLQMFVGFLNEPIKRGAMDLSYISAALNILETMMDRYPKDIELFQICLSLLEDISQKEFNGTSAIGIVTKHCAYYVNKMENIGKNKLPSSIMVKIVKILNTLAKRNFSSTYDWLHTTEQQLIPIGNYLLQEMDSPYSEVRFAVAEIVWPMFYKLRNAPLESRPTLTTWLQHITGSCPEVGESHMYSDQNNVKCAIHCLSVIVITTPYLRMHSLYQILKFLNGHDVCKELGQKVFHLLSQELKIQDPKKMISEYLLYFLDKWVMTGDLKEFPYWLTSSTINEFCFENKALIFSTLWIMNHGYLEDFCEEVSSTVPEMLQVCSANVLAFTLRRTVTNLDSGESKAMMHTTQQVVEQLMKLFPMKTIFEILSTKDNSLLYCIFRLFFDDEEIRIACSNIILIENGFEVCIPENNPHCYTKNMIKQSLLCISSFIGEAQAPSFIDYLVQMAPSHLRDVMFCLAKDAINALTPSDSLLLLIAFQAFVNMVAEILILEAVKDPSNDINQVWTGFMRDVCFMYVRVMRRSWWNADEVVRVTAFFYLKNFILGHGVTVLQTLHIVVVPLIGALVDLVEEKLVKLFETDVLKLLEFLMKLEFLKETLIQLCPFPNNQEFSDLILLQRRLKDVKEEASLQEELMYFLKSYETYSCCRCESLLHLQNVFKTKKPELRIFYEELQIKKGYFSKYRESLLHKVVCLLLKLCTSSDYKIGNEAAKCLAELGSGDLKGLILIHETVSSVEATSEIMKSNALHKLTMKCFELLPKYLIDYDIEVVETVSSILQAVINSKEGEMSLSEVEFPWQMNLAEDFTVRDKSTDVQLSSSVLEFSDVRFNRTSDLWIPSDDCSHSKWITTLVKALLECFNSNSSYLEMLTEICSLKVAFCEEIFPFVLEVQLRCGELSSHVNLFKRIRKFFAASYHTFICKSKGLNPERLSLVKNKTSIITMLNAVNFLNLQHPGQHAEYRTPEGSVIDYLHCAVVAQNCSAFFSAIQYCTLWLSHSSRGNEPHTLKFHIDSSTLHINEILQVLRESYAGIGDTDALYGCGTSHLLEPKGRIEHFKHMEKWEQVLRSYELEVTNHGPRNNIDGLLMAMQMVGMEELLMSIIDMRDSEELHRFKYECGWRLGSWDLLSKFNGRRKHSSSLLMIDSQSRMEYLERSDEDQINKEFHRNLFVSLKYLQSGRYSESVNSIKIARSCVIDSLALASLEACQNLYKPITRLQALKEVEDFANAFITSKHYAVPDVLEQWNKADSIGHKCFKTTEPVKAVRLTLLEYCCGIKLTGSNSFICDEHPATKALIEYRLDLAHIAREEGMYSVSEKYLRAVRQVPNIEYNENYTCRLEFEEAQLFWAKGDRDIAKIVVQNLVTNLDPLLLDRESYLCYTRALTTFGNWLMETHSERAKITLLNYFSRTCELLDDNHYHRDIDEYLNALKALAVFADEQYVLAVKYMNSSAYAKKRQCATDSKFIVSDYRGTKQTTSDERKSLILLEKQAQLDENELSDMESEKNSYLNLALSNYIKFLTYSHKTQLEMVFRLVSLMLEETEMKEVLENEMKSIPTCKFIPVIPQLFAKILVAKGSTSVFLRELIEKCALDHPHHVLPAIFAVAYSLNDLNENKGSDSFITSAQKTNAKSAKIMLAQLKNVDQIKTHIIQLEKLWEALISLAYFHVTRKRQKINISSSQGLYNIKDLDCVQIPTLKLSESPTGEYRHIISIWRYIPEFQLVGGINVPKKLTCIGSNGVHYQQLLKGKDDLRQDAVMQQVFELMNNLLQREEEARKRSLVMRTYKVVPLTHRSGIIEWCENTKSIGNYLYDTKSNFGAHASYNPSDYPVKTCRNMLLDVASSTKIVRLQVYLEICENLQPVFRHYFFSNFPNPGIWYEMRQAYTRSVATSSMIGYIVGLGDRHMENILIDALTSEVIHIDLGIAFEQGKTLNTPETVPFRLTRDLVDGMGISGVEGVFRRSCEVTMGLMRKYRQAILTVLEVLIYDPLYGWTLKPKWKGMNKKSTGTEEYQSQTSSTVSSGTSKDSSVEKNTIAERALERIEHKLLGIEDGDPPSSVEAQVERLIQEAQDPENLCMLFPGWQPYL